MISSSHCAHLPARWRCPLWLAALALWAASALAADKVGCYVSTGDNDWLWTSPPVNSEASIEALFDSMQKVFGVDRVYWRGSHSEWVVDRFVSRPESFHLHDFWVWQRHLIKDVGQTALALRAARKRGMEIWGFSPLFDHGAHARSDAAKLGLPAVIENRLRVEHPEWVPVDRHGRRRQAGPIELAYPEARKALVEQYVEMANRGYDGVAFYTYVEHTSFRFEDEFGYGPPIVDEFKRRYGQDIRSEPFDKHAWYRLRGEYVTQFLRELSAAYRRHGKKLGMAIDPQETHYPAPWLGLGRDLRPAGRIYMDWERWVREGLVDEIMVYCNGPLEAALNAVLAETRGTSCAVSAIRGSAPFTPEHQHFTAAGVRRVMVGSAAELEWGYPAEQPASALEGGDFLARLRVLRQAEEKKTTIPATQLVAATRDANVLVRRQAIRALESLAPSEALPAIEAALGDSEVGVRCVAAAALAKLNGPTTVPRLFEALRRGPGFQFEQAAGNTLANLPLAFTADILKGCRDADVTVRRMTAYALSRGQRRDEAAPHLIQAMDGPDPCVRFWAAGGLSRLSFRPGVPECLLAHLADPHPSVRNRVALALTPCFQSHSRWVSARQLRALEALAACFSQLGDADADWSFRPVGNALLALGPRGQDALQQFLGQRQNPRLADLAWHVLHVRQNGWTYATCAPAEAEQGYRQHPAVTSAKLAPRPIPVEPERMPYLAQSFDGFKPYESGKLGDYLHEAGQWRTLGDAPPAPVIQARTKRGERGNAVMLCPGGPPVEGLRVDYRLTAEQATVEFWILRGSQDAAFAVTWKDSGSGHVDVGLTVAADGTVSVLTGDRVWTSTPARMPSGAWQRVRLEIDGHALRYRVAIGTETLATVRENIEIRPGQTFNILTVSPQRDGGVLYLDDVSVTVPNPAR